MTLTRNSGSVGFQAEQRFTSSTAFQRHGTAQLVCGSLVRVNQIPRQMLNSILGRDDKFPADNELEPMLCRPTLTDRGHS
ncbi:subtilisin-like protease-like isoform X1 [Anopheles sinensis]|uniref:Subtilisin-like protease-like isoform X1 n=1 Tax=Anopheles sinensis TaxID=74873 RepID=A0A084WC73_ANOSI|nr:subtilisin-like protease-like isoform X1 [Anopheles sinensis]